LRSKADGRRKRSHGLPIGRCSPLSRRRSARKTGSGICYAPAAIVGLAYPSMLTVQR
jgi:hypothetical protein